MTGTTAYGKDLLLYTINIKLFNSFYFSFHNSLYSIILGQLKKKSAMCDLVYLDGYTFKDCMRRFYGGSPNESTFQDLDEAVLRRFSNLIYISGFG